MLSPLPWSGLDLFFHIALAVYLVIFLFLHANHIRFLAVALADMMNPQTPPRKLFKPSSKTKTPTSIKKQRPTTPAPSSAQSHDDLTPTETASRSAEGLGAPDTTKGPVDSRGGDTSSQTDSPVKSVVGKSRELLSSSADDLPKPSNPTDALNSPTDVSKYFAEQGNTEMSTFVSALAGRTIQDQRDDTGNIIDANKEASEKPTGATKVASESIEELPRDDALVVSPNERTKEVLEEATQDATSDVANSTDITPRGSEAKPNDSVQDQNFAEKTPDIPEPAGVSREAEGTMNHAEDQVSGAKPLNAVGEPDTSSITKGAHIGMPNGTGKSGNAAQATADSADQNSTGSLSGVLEDGTQVADNMGQPAHIERRIEIPLPRPEKVVDSPPQPTKPDVSNISAGLGDFEGLPGTEDLQSTENLPDLPEDPPEEVLDPSVHSPSSNISPIPKIPKITPIGMAPPPNLLRLAHGLGGNVIDDVGNIVDASGKVLGHATGDLPAMVGREVADNGEVYGEGGEVIGYVSENFIESPPPADIPDNVLGGLKVDHEGNILDSNGNIIGHFNDKAAKNGALAPFMKRSKRSESPKRSASQPADDKPREEKKPKVNAHTGGSPSDIFLDVKSTTDGIQLTIRIPTTFGRQQEDS
ncbi:hypothetical protein F5Y13DRAFT_123704 [Hypoxylon sp. FL1857]|nr:hypothetical protein F5Y13DRAFT_123704 [Hypoxylon sp. FL1857]